MRKWVFTLFSGFFKCNEAIVAKISFYLETVRQKLSLLTLLARIIGVKACYMLQETLLANGKIGTISHVVFESLAHVFIYTRSYFYDVYF